MLGAGIGSRLKPFTTILPKPLIPILGVPSIEFALASLKDAGVVDAVVNIHAHADHMRKYLNSAPVTGLSLSVSDESSELLGSAGGFRKALPFFDHEVFFAMNADTVSMIDLPSLARRHAELNQKQEVWMTLVLNRGKTLDALTGAYREIFVDESSGLITGFGEKKTGIPFYAGVAVCDPRCFEHLTVDRPAEFVPEVLEPLIRQKKVGFQWSESLWMDIGSAELWWKAHFELLTAFQAGVLPMSWSQKIQAKLGSVVVSSESGVVDYDDASPLGKNYIQLEGIKYEISGLGT